MFNLEIVLKFETYVIKKIYEKSQKVGSLNPKIEPVFSMLKILVIITSKVSKITFLIYEVTFCKFGKHNKRQLRQFLHEN